MKGSRPAQAVLTAGNDLSKTEETLATIDAMVDGLNDHDIDNMGRFFHPDFRWIGNAGCGFKQGLKEFQDGWQRPFQAAFSDKVCIDEARVTQGEWCAAFGRQEAVHSGEFMGIEPTGRRVEIRYMDFWKVENGKIADNWVMVDFPYIMRQLGADPFQGEGWEKFDSGAMPVQSHTDRTSPCRNRQMQESFSGRVHWLAAASRRDVVVRSGWVAVVVGSLLAIINHGNAILAGQLDMERVLKIGLTYLVPYAVATWSAVQTSLAAEADAPD